MDECRMQSAADGVLGIFGDTFGHDLATEDRTFPTIVVKPL
jgi:hypothetical protein